MCTMRAAGSLPAHRSIADPDTLQELMKHKGDTDADEPFRQDQYH
jgi:hypothetical protein